MRKSKKGLILRKETGKNIHSGNKNYNWYQICDSLKKAVMKSLKFYLVTIIFSLSFVACVAPPRPPKPPKHPRHGAKPMPPGQAKKIYGTKSAKPFAPGQNK